jgi:hypothetical protein
MQGEEGLEEHEAKVSAGGVAGQDDLVRGDRGVEGARGRGDKVEVCSESVDESGGEWILRGEAIANGEDRGFCTLG